MKTIKTIHSCLSVSLMLGILGFTSLFAGTIRVAIPSYGEDTLRVFKQIVQDFKHDNPDITVNLEVGSWETWQQKVTTAFINRDPADIIFTTRDWLSAYVAKNQITALDPLLSKKTLAMFPKSLLDGVRIDGKLYALPSVTSTRTLYVNTDLVTRAGAKIPTTWDELYETARLITEKTAAYGYGLHGKGVEMEKYFLYTAWNMGGGVLDKPIGGTKSVLNSSGSIRAAKFLSSMIDKGYTQPNVTAYVREDLNALFFQNKLGMFISHGGPAQQIEKAGHAVNFVQIGVPSSKKGQKGTTLGVIDVVHLSEASTHKAAASKFLIYSFKPKYQADWIAKAGLLPVTTVASNEQAFQKPYLQALSSVVPQARFVDVHDESNKIVDIMKNGLQAIYNGQTSPEKGMENMHRKVTRALR